MPGAPGASASPRSSIEPAGQGRGQSPINPDECRFEEVRGFCSRTAFSGGLVSLKIQQLIRVSKKFIPCRSHSYFYPIRSLINQYGFGLSSHSVWNELISAMKLNSLSYVNSVSSRASFVKALLNHLTNGQFHKISQSGSART